MKFPLPEEPSQGSLDDMYYLDYLQRLYRHIRGDTDWIAPSLQNSWVNYGGIHPNAGYRLKNGVVYIQGVIKSGTTTIGTVLFNIPAGYRPATDLIFSNNESDSFASISAQSNGDVIIRAGGNSYLSLQCSFIAEQ